MKITRTVNGIEMEFELTWQEEHDCYFELQRNCDREDVENELEIYLEFEHGLYDEGNDWDHVEQEYGFTKQEILDMIPEMVERKRKYEDDAWTSDKTWDAIQDVMHDYTI